MDWFLYDRDIRHEIFKASGFLFEMPYYTELVPQKNHHQLKIFALIESTLIWDETKFCLCCF